jgi:hypothetical protein
MKTFNQFIQEVKTLVYKMAVPHKVFLDGKVQKVKSGHAVPKRSSSSASGD